MYPSNFLQRIFMFFWGSYMLVGMHYFQSNLGGSGLALPINDISWIFISILIGLGLWQITLQQKIYYNQFLISSSLAIIIMLLPVLYADPITVGESYPRLFGLIGGGLLFFSLLQMQFERQYKLVILYFILAAVAVESLLSLSQYYLLSTSNWMGYSTAANRPYGIFQQPNVSASFLTTGVALSLYLLTEANSIWKKLCCYLVGFIATLPVVLLLSRTGYLALAISPLLVLPWAWQKTQSNKKNKIFIWLACLLFAVITGLFSLDSATSIARNSAALTDPGGRVPIYLHSLDMFLQKPFLGWGYGSFEVSFLHSYAEAFKNGMAISGAPENLDHPHNEILYWAVEGGIIAILGMLFVVIAFIKILCKCNLRKSFAYIGLLFPILLHTQTEYPFYHSAAHWAIFIVLVWYIVSGTQKLEQKSFQYTFFLRTFALLIPLLTSAYMLTTLQTTSLLVDYARSNPKNLTPLLKVINPMSWITRLEFDVMQFRLQTALYKNDNTEMQHYIDWAKNMVQVTPRVNIYMNWILALEKLHKIDDAKKLLEQVKFLYPNNSKVHNFIIE